MSSVTCPMGHRRSAPELVRQVGEWRIEPGAEAGDLYCSRCGCFVQSYIRRPDPLWEPLPQLCSQCVWEVPGNPSGD